MARIGRQRVQGSPRPSPLRRRPTPHRPGRGRRLRSRAAPGSAGAAGPERAACRRPVMIERVAPPARPPGPHARRARPCARPRCLLEAAADAVEQHPGLAVADAAERLGNVGPCGPGSGQRTSSRARANPTPLRSRRGHRLMRLPRLLRWPGGLFSSTDIAARCIQAVLLRFAGPGRSRGPGAFRRALDDAPGYTPGPDKQRIRRRANHSLQRVAVSAYDAIARLYDPWSRSVVEDVAFYVEEAVRSGRAGRRARRGHGPNRRADARPRASG